MARSRLRQAALDLEKGKRPAGLDTESQEIRSASYLLPKDVAFDQAPGEPMKIKKGTAHISI
jgi:hypothetical protein